MTRSFYIKIRGKPFGPFDEEQVREMITGGNLVQESEISEDRIHWGTVSDHACLRFAVGQTASRHNADAQGEHAIGTHDERNAASPVAQSEQDFPSEQMQWYYSLDGQSGFGPYPESTITTLVRAGQIPPQALVWQKNGTPDTVSQTEPFARYVPQPKSRNPRKDRSKARKKVASQPVDDGVRVSDDIVRPVVDSLGWVFVLAMASVIIAVTVVCLFLTAAVTPFGRWLTGDVTAETGTWFLLRPGLVPLGAFIYFAVVFMNYYTRLGKFNHVRTEYRFRVALNSLKKVWQALVILLLTVFLYVIFVVGFLQMSDKPGTSTERVFQMEERIKE